MPHGLISGYKTYVVLDATRGISAKEIDAAVAAMKNSGTCQTIGYLPPFLLWLVAWHTGRTSVFDQRTFSTCSRQ